MKRIFVLLFSFFILFQVNVKADEGMWLLTLLNKNYDDMKKQGFKLTPEDIYNLNKASLKDAVVSFGDYCTGEIISDKGLLITNHHCGYGSIQMHSTIEHDYLKDGFWAKSLDEEIPTPGLFVRFLVKIEDVTAEMLKKVKDKMNEEERNEAIDKMREKIIEKATKGNDYLARVQSFFGGNQYFLLVYETYSDVRMVGAPPSSIGKFGHDTDNWIWPRHTCDFSMFRVYMSKDGKPAEYAKDNVPYKPKHVLPISLKGVKKNDFAFVMGYPGTTTRYMTSHQVNEVMKINNPAIEKIRGIRLGIQMEDMKVSDKIRIQYSSKYSRTSNYWKFAIEQNKGLQRLDVIGKKQKIEADFMKWVNADANRKKEYGEALSLIEKAIKEREDLLNTSLYIRESIWLGSELIAFASRAEKLYELLKDGKTSGDDYTKTVNQLKKRAETFYKNYSPKTDEKVVKAMYKLFKKDIASKNYPKVVAQMKDVDAYVSKMFKTSLFTSEKKLNAFLKAPKLKVLQNDMAFKTALSVVSKRREVTEQLKKISPNLNKGNRLFIKGLMEMKKDKFFYPDANFTMRLTYGTVGDYKPRDAVFYDYYTTLAGVMEKEIPNDYEFHVEPRLKELYKKKDYGRYGENGKMITCFTTNNDITGGNSGSPVLNAKGELIGLAFDGNSEAMSGDIAFETELQKCINVDIRYVLFIVDKFAGATNLIQELKFAE
ncbi:MAG: serine protease [Bacteroidia bacterium]|nr:MAG: serine protease [Bacteroidia bacterium]